MLAHKIALDPSQARMIRGLQTLSVDYGPRTSGIHQTGEKMSNDKSGIVGSFVIVETT